MNDTPEEQLNDKMPSQEFSGEEFLASLESLTADDIAPPSPKKRDFRRGAAKIGRKILLAVSSCVCVVSFASLVNTLYNYRVGDELYSSLAEEFYGMEQPSAVRKLNVSPKSRATPDFAASLSLADDYSLVDNLQADTETNEQFQRMRAMLNYYSTTVNDDTVGWIKAENTNIDYIVMQSEDNEYYLNNNYKGEYLPAGSIFVDYRCSSNLYRNHNTILYGHNMHNGSMFHDVTLWLDEQFFNENPYITLTTEDGIFTYEVFSVRKVSMYDDYITTAFPTHEAFVEFAYRMKEQSLFQREGIEFELEDRILTLSTCTNVIQSERYCLQAKMISVEK